MNILHISRTMGQGGAEKIVYQLCKDNKKHRQYVVSCGGIYVKELDSLDVKHFEIPDIDKKNPFLMLICIYRIWNIVVKENIDIIHSHHRMAVFYARIITFFRPNVKNVYTAHNIFYNKKYLTKFSLKNAQIVAVGDGVKNNLMNEFGIKYNKIEVIYNSINIILIKKKNLQLEQLKQNGKYLIGIIGRLSEEKGIDIFLNAIAIVSKKYPKVLGVIIGDGILKKDMEKLVKKLNIVDNIIFLGYQENVLDIINQLDFIVSASRFEGLPLVPIEVYSQGKTIVASNINGNNEIVTDRVDGLLFENENIQELVDNMLELIENYELKRKLEINANLKFQEKFIYEKFIDSYNSVYDKICKRKRSFDL